MSEEKETHRPRNNRPILPPHLQPPVLVFRRRLLLALFRHHRVRSRLPARARACFAGMRWWGRRQRRNDGEQLLLKRVEEESEELFSIFLVTTLCKNI